VLRTLVVGLGHAGIDLHWSVLRRLRAEQPSDPGPAYGFDPRPEAAPPPGSGLRRVGSLAEAARRLPPEETVVHVCTPPVARLDLVRGLADLGFTKILVEKPLAVDAAGAAGLAALRRDAGLDLTVVAHWLDSALTVRALELVRSGRLGALRSIGFVQRKPRLRRTLLRAGHPTAFDIELPHSVGVALRLAGDAELVDAEWSDMEVGEVRVPRTGTARLVVEHAGGVRTDIFSDLTSPVRERRVTLELEGGRVIGHYPGSQDDDHAQLRVRAGGQETRAIFPDDSLTTFLRRVYRDHAAGADGSAEFALNRRVVELLAEAKAHCLDRDGLARV
jgi:predicted dehydrogenase